MTTIEYFKSQAKNLHKDFKTQKPYFDPELECDTYNYSPRFFDVEALLNDFDINEESFSRMNALHIITRLGGFKKWDELIHASTAELELARLLFDNMHKLCIEEWEYYLLDIENEHDIEFTDEGRLEVFNLVYANEEGHQSYGYDYRIKGIKIVSDEAVAPNPKKRLKKKKAGVQITSLPLSEADQQEFIKTANAAFEYDLDWLEVEKPELMRKLWNPEKYLSEAVLTIDKLPIDRDYALSLVGAFMLHEIIALSEEADQIDGEAEGV
ncbi:hypothetical protein GCM10022289_19130 [Pedobacter jeongneungensis]|uniref:Uncharacterized protein n=1 Tax=Pedobacter jeongneungensis TaxID=947309 RepID=A0ABP8BBY4_9SPHI